jgi:hypothetical protein
MEASSENALRGRPRVFSERELSDADERGALSHRQRQNRAYARRARLRLAELVWWEDLAKNLSVPQYVLAELGRIEDSGTFAEAAWWYTCSGRELTGKQVTAKIKEMRNGVRPREDPMLLYKRLMRTIKDYRISHPEASLLSVEGEIRLVLETVRRFPQQTS